MQEFIDDELQQMNERESAKSGLIGEAVSISDPIHTLKSQKMVTVDKGTTIAQAVKKLQKEGAHCILVMNKSELAGIFTERDVIQKVVGRGLDHSKEIVDTYMTENPDTLHMDDPIVFALNRMYEGGYRHIPIIDDSHKPVGVVSIQDIINHLAVYYSNEVLNLPPKPVRIQKSRESG